MGHALAGRAVTAEYRENKGTELLSIGLTIEKEALSHFERWYIIVERLGLTLTCTIKLFGISKLPHLLKKGE